LVGLGDESTKNMKFFWKYLFPAVFGLIIYITVRLVNDFITETRFWLRPWYTTAIELFFVMVCSYAQQFILGKLIRKFNSGPPRAVTAGRILKEFAIVYFWTFLTINIIIVPMAALTDDGLGAGDFVIAHIIPALYVLLYFALRRSQYYFTQIVSQQIRIEKIERDKLQTELKFLKAQYHPHFLFNALNTIYFQMDENVQEAKKSIEKFSGLLRYQIYDQSQRVPASQEMEYLKTYIELQQLRSSEKLKLSVEFDPAINGQLIYPLLFLPLVENAFKYVGGDYLLQIRVDAGEDFLKLSVINSIPPTAREQRPGGIGLENLSRRLELLYPGQYELSTQKSPDKYIAHLQLHLNNS